MPGKGSAPAHPHLHRSGALLLCRLPPSSSHREPLPCSHLCGHGLLQLHFKLPTVVLLGDTARVAVSAGCTGNHAHIHRAGTLQLHRLSAALGPQWQAIMTSPHSLQVLRLTWNGPFSRPPQHLKWGKEYTSEKDKDRRCPEGAGNLPKD